MAKKERKNEKLLIVLLIGLVITLIAAFFFLMWNPPLPAPAKGAVRVYFLKQEKLFPVERKILAGETAEEAAIRGLLKGPARTEKEKGAISHVPAGTKMKAVSKENGIAFVNFSKELEQYEGGAEETLSMVSQIVYTLTDIPGIKKVRILVDGSSEVVLGGEGYVIDKPLTRRDVQF